jgi:tRNA (uracil-5-)-methyltransferase TRM9
MEPEVASRLLALNRQFYQTRGQEFSATRMRLQPGVQRVMGMIFKSARILDLGCGNGELARQLAQIGFTGQYIGLDASSSLLEEARKQNDRINRFSFILTDLSSPDWDELVDFHPAPSGDSLDIVLAFAVLHHIPGSDLRRNVLKKTRRLISNSGRLIHSEWQFLNSPRLVERIQPWEMAGLTNQDVDPGDYLLDWRRGGYSLRYVHFFTQAELSSLAIESGFKVIETYLSDGENGRLGLYQIWSPV